MCNAENIHLIVDSLLPHLKPPVSNILLYDGDMKVMLVGGPNKRIDYHIENGEELFYQLKGDMYLNIILDSNQILRLNICEGQIFLLPAGIAHSPQRCSNSAGIVFERTRENTELDALRWYVKDSTKISFEKFFYCTDLTTQIKAAIDDYNELPMESKNQEQFYSYPRDSFEETLLNKSASYTSIDPPRSLKDCFQEVLGYKDRKMSSEDDSLVVSNLIYDSEFVVESLQYISAKLDNASLNWRKILKGKLTYCKELFLWQQSGRSLITYNNNSIICVSATKVIPDSLQQPIQLEKSNYVSSATTSSATNVSDVSSSSSSSSFTMQSGDIVLLRLISHIGTAPSTIVVADDVDADSCNVESHKDSSRCDDKFIEEEVNESGVGQKKEDIMEDNQWDVYATQYMEGDCLLCITNRHHK